MNDNKFGATHVQDKSCRTWFSFVKAFTLAEVLITLGIIGVVAAMTIPTLVKNYQKTVWVNQLKKSVSTVENGFKLMLADEGVENLSDTSVFKTICEDPDDGCNDYSLLYYTDDKIPFLKGISKYFKFVETYTDANKAGLKSKYKYLSGELDVNDDLGFFGDELGVVGYLEDGTMLLFNGQITRELNSGSHEDTILIDVNGKKGPNQWGRDLFQFDINNSGKISPYNRPYSELACDLKKGGQVCAYQVIKNDWKMNY